MGPLRALFFCENVGGEYVERKRKYVKRFGDKTNRFEIRLSDSELDELELTARLTEKTKTEIIREGIRLACSSLRRLS